LTYIHYFILLFSRGRACTETEKNERGREESNRHNHRMCSAKYYNLTRIDCDLNNVFLSRQLHVNEDVERKLKKKEKGPDHSMKNVTLCLRNPWTPHDGTRPMIRQQRGNVRRANVSTRSVQLIRGFLRKTQPHAATSPLLGVTSSFLLSFFLSLSLPLSHSRLRA